MAQSPSCPGLVALGWLWPRKPMIKPGNNGTKDVGVESIGYFHILIHDWLTDSLLILTFANVFFFFDSLEIEMESRHLTNRSLPNSSLSLKVPETIFRPRTIQPFHSPNRQSIGSLAPVSVTHSQVSWPMEWMSVLVAPSPHTSGVTTMVNSWAR